MSDYDEDSDDDYGDGEWMYVEDHYDEVDDLVEHTCPSPALQETPHPQEYDMYDYWEDLTYLSDSIYDLEKEKHASKERSSVTGKKRKRSPHSIGHTPKRQRVGLGNETVSRSSKDRSKAISSNDSTVLWKSQDQRNESTTGRCEAGEVESKRVALLKDWKDRYQATCEFPNEEAPHADDEASIHSDDNDDDDEAMVTGEGFDLNNLQSVAGSLSSDQIEALKSILKGQGLNPEALEVVLQDLISGQEPDLDDEDDDEDEDKDGDANPVDDMSDATGSFGLHLAEESAEGPVKEGELDKALDVHDAPLQQPRSSSSVVAEMSNGCGTESPNSKPPQSHGSMHKPKPRLAKR